MSVGPPARRGKGLLALAAVAYAARRRRRAHELMQPDTAPEPYPVQAPQPDLPGAGRRSAAAAAARWAATAMIIAGAEELVRRNRKRVVLAGTGLAFRAAARRWPSLERHIPLVDGSPAPRSPQDTRDRTPAAQGRSR